MLGDVLGESKGKRIVRRVLSSGPLKVEVSFEDTGTMLGVATNGTGTYTSEARPDGSLLWRRPRSDDYARWRANHVERVGCKARS
jgi:hypothetical protein